MAFLEISHLNKTFHSEKGEVQALKDIHLDVEPYSITDIHV
ncbi:hypothetical protein P2R12_08210 [Cytobacillus oceanisediminis]|nr:hypothetical protein [Cytobacillus oceanisediminis]MDF2036957.1 hypothetical protein [Cytobacillus oceanisediminis]